MNNGFPPTERNARTGLLTPPGVTRTARSKSDWDRLRFIGLSEPEGDLLLGRLRRVTGVDDVFTDIEGVIAADAAGGGFERASCADHLPDRRDRIRSLQHHRDDGSGGNEGNDSLEKA